MIAGYVQSLTSRQEFLNMKHFAKGVFAGCKITIGDDWPGDATAKKAFLELLPKNLPTFDDASVNEDGTSVGVACDLEELLKVVLGCAGIQKLVSGAGVIVKLVLDAARIVNGENVAVMSISVVRHGSFMCSAVLYPRPLAVKGSGPITCERKAMLLNEWAIDPALFCCPLFFPFLLWVSSGVFLGV